MYPCTKYVLLTQKLIQTSKSGEGITWDADRRWNWEQRGGHTHLHCQYSPARMYWEVKAAEGKNKIKVMKMALEKLWSEIGL